MPDYNASRRVMGCILTIDSLTKKGKVNVNGCYPHKRATEFVKHLLLWCHSSYQLRSLAYSLLGVKRVELARSKRRYDLAEISMEISATIST